MPNSRLSKFPRERPRPWTPEEDQALLNMVRFAGRKDWTRIAVQFPGRTGKHCRQRYNYHLEHEYKKGGWTPEEDQTIIDLQAKIGNCWSKIAKSLPGRSDNSVKNRWYCALLRQQDLSFQAEDNNTASNRRGSATDSYSGMENDQTTSCVSQSKMEIKTEDSKSEGVDSPILKPWTSEEDQLLLQAANQSAEKDWLVISQNFPGRTPKQCRQRYTYHQEHEYKKGGWSREEDQIILSMQQKYGNCWSKIAKCLPGRSDNSVKNRWYCALLRRRVGKEEINSYAQESAEREREERKFAAEFSRSGATLTDFNPVALQNAFAKTSNLHVGVPFLPNWHPDDMEDASQFHKRQGLFVPNSFEWGNSQPAPRQINAGENKVTTSGHVMNAMDVDSLAEAPPSPTHYARQLHFLRTLPFTQTFCYSREEAPQIFGSAMPASGAAAINGSTSTSSGAGAGTPAWALPSFAAPGEWSSSCSMQAGEAVQTAPPSQTTPSEFGGERSEAAAMFDRTDSSGSHTRVPRWDGRFSDTDGAASHNPFENGASDSWPTAAGTTGASAISVAVGGGACGDGDGAAACCISSPSASNEIRRRNSWSRWSIDDECRRVAMVASSAPAAESATAAFPAGGGLQVGQGPSVLALSADDMPAFSAPSFAGVSLGDISSCLRTCSSASNADGGGTGLAGSWPSAQTYSTGADQSFETQQFGPGPPSAPPSGGGIGLAGGGLSSWEHMLGLSNDQPVARQLQYLQSSAQPCAAGVAAGGGSSLCQQAARQHYGPLGNGGMACGPGCQATLPYTMDHNGASQPELGSPSSLHNAANCCQGLGGGGALACAADDGRGGGACGYFFGGSSFAAPGMAEVVSISDCPH